MKYGRSTTTYYLVVAMLINLTAARCPHYMHDVSPEEKREAEALGSQIFMFEPRPIDKALPTQVIDMSYWSASMTPLCTSKVATRWLTTYTVDGATRKKYVEVAHLMDPETCKKHRDADMFLKPRFVLGATTADKLEANCKGPWRANTTAPSDTAAQRQLARELFSYWFQAAARSSPKPRVATAACKKGVDSITIVLGTLGACFKRAGASVEVVKQDFGPKDKVATVWAAMRYTCTEAPRAVKAVALRATMPYKTVCAWDPSVSPNLD